MRRGVMRVARRGHGQPADLRIFKGVTVVAAQGGRGVEDFERVDRQSFQGGETNAGAEKIVGMRRNGEAAAFVDDLANFPGRFALSDRAGSRRCRGDGLPRWSLRRPG